jgi:hypothetical protein
MVGQDPFQVRLPDQRTPAPRFLLLGLVDLVDPGEVRLVATVFALSVDASLLLMHSQQVTKTPAPQWDSPLTRSHAPGAPAAAIHSPGRTRVDLFVLAMQPALVHSPDLHANPMTESDIRQKIAYRPLRYGP